VGSENEVVLNKSCCDAACPMAVMRGVRRRAEDPETAVRVDELDRELCGQEGPEH